MERKDFTRHLFLEDLENAENKNQSFRRQTFQKNGIRQIYVCEVACQPHFDQKNDQAETTTAPQADDQDIGS
jgi:hypothetical protein